MAQLETYSIFQDMANRPALDLADRLSELAPMDDARVFFTSGGGEAIETATKLARLYWEAKGQPERVHIVSRTNAYHGAMGFGTSIGGIEPNRAGFGPLVPETTRVPHDSVDALERTIAELGRAQRRRLRVRAGDRRGGRHPAGARLPRERHRALPVARRARRVRSVICGFGRLGTWYRV